MRKTGGKDGSALVVRPTRAHQGQPRRKRGLKLEGYQDDNTPR